MGPASAALRLSSLPKQNGVTREALHKSSGKQALRIGLDRKAKTAVIPVGIARIFNAAGHPRPQMHATFDLCRVSLGLLKLNSPPLVTS